MTRHLCPKKKVPAMIIICKCLPSMHQSRRRRRQKGKRKESISFVYKYLQLFSLSVVFFLLHLKWYIFTSPNWTRRDRFDRIVCWYSFSLSFRSDSVHGGLNEINDQSVSFGQFTTVVHCRVHENHPTLQEILPTHSTISRRDR